MRPTVVWALLCAGIACGGSGAIPDGGDADLAAPAEDAGFDVTRVPSTLGAFTTEGSAGCGQIGAPTGERVLGLMVDGAPRQALVVVPSSYDPLQAYPLVFVFHWRGATSGIARIAHNLEPAAAGRAIFAYPDGTGNTWDVTLHGVNQDMDLVFAVRDALRAEYCVDQRRTFGTGYSAGGFFVNQLACRYGADLLTAIAPQSGGIDPQDDTAYVYGPDNPDGGPYLDDGHVDFMCPVDGTPVIPPPLPRLPPAVMVIHGQCDEAPNVDWPMGRRTVEHWGYAARCATTPSVVTTTFPGCPASTDCPTSTADPCYRAPGCAREVVFCAIPAMGHALWCDAAARIWAFFAAH